jgi:glycosyltransferase involved in cell wall biosynthesis
MTPTILVVTTVHSPDDTRIRDRLIRSLAGSWDVVYACRVPGPSDIQGLTWLPLRGGRLLRNAKALTVLLRGPWDAAVVHDPEVVPAALLARLVRRRPVVFDVHEDLSAQIEGKTWIPRWLKSGARVVARVIYGLADRGLILTLAEPGYHRLFKRAHPVFPNYPNYEKWPEPTASGDGSAVYLGDVQPARGISEAVEACGRSGMPLTVIGPAPSSFKVDLQEVASAHETDLQLVGPMPNPEALKAIAGASVGLSPLLPLPNYRDSLPTKTLEYLAMGLPVVASDLPGTREILQHWQAVWLVPPGDVSMMAEAISAAARPEVKEQAVEQAERVRRQFAWPREEVLSFYQSLINP